jgi:hypothetical protein
MNNLVIAGKKDISIPRYRGRHHALKLILISIAEQADSRRFYDEIMTSGND